MKRPTGSALIGSTGFVGGALRRQLRFDALYHRADIDRIRDCRFESVICAAAPAAKWLANRRPEEDRANIQTLVGLLKTVRADSFVLISTVDVYPVPVAVYEDTAVDVAAAPPYGRHRYELEEFIRARFAEHYIIRLPGLYDTGLKKNFLFDLLNDNRPDLTNRESVFQFYGLERLSRDIETVRSNKLRLVNLATEPLKAAVVAKECFGLEFGEVTAPVVQYDMRTRFAGLFGGAGWYVESAAESLRGIRRFVATQKG